MPSDDRMRGGIEPVAMGVFSFVGYTAGYALSLLLARNLSREEFNDYNVGVSALLLLSALAPLGLEKFTLKAIPILTQRQDWGRSRGFLRFAMTTAFVVGAALSLMFDSFLDTIFEAQGRTSYFELPLIVACLPLLSLFLVLVEFGTAYRAPVAAAAVYRVAVPLLMLALNVVCLRSQIGVTGLSASVCFAASWLASTALLWWLVRTHIPKGAQSAKVVYAPWHWLKEATPLLVHGVLFTTIAQSGVIILELSNRFHTDASVFAVAMQTGSFVVLFTTSANRFYLPKLSVLLMRGDRLGIARLARRRLLLMGGIALGFAVLVFCFGRAILRAHGEDFEHGYAATCIVAAGASVSSALSLSPLGLQFAGAHQLVIRSLALAAITSVGGCLYLSDRYGATGAAIAYAVPLVVLHLFLAWVSWSRLKQRVELRRDPPHATGPAHPR